MNTVETRDITPLTDFNENIHSGHVFTTAFRDIIDNSIDAGAKTISAFLAKDEDNKNIFVVTDFGSGMAGDVLHKIAQKGFTTKQNSTRPDGTRYLGKMGKGFKNVVAFFSNSGCATVVSKTAEGSIWAMEYNQKRISTLQKHEVDCHECVFKDSNDDKYRTLWLNWMKTSEYDWADSGTMIIFRNLKTPVLNRLRKSMNPTAVNKINLSMMLGETYKHFITDNVVINIGLEYTSMHQVNPVDEMCGVKPKISVDFDVNGGKVALELYNIPEEYNEKLQKSVHYRPVNNQNSGLYVYRNGRLHTSTQNRPTHPVLPEKAIEQYIEEATFGLNGRTKRKPKEDNDYTSFGESHGRHNTVRIALRFTDINDEDFAVDVNKTDIQFTDSVADIALWVYDNVRKNDKYDLRKEREAELSVYQTGQGRKNPVSKDWLAFLKKHKSSIDARKAQVVSIHNPEDQALKVLQQFMESLAID